MDEPDTLGGIIRLYRQKRRLTGEEIGRRAGLSQSRISKIETGAIENPRKNELDKLMNILDVPEKIRQQLFTLLPTPKERLYRVRAEYPYRRVLNLQKRSKFIRIFIINLVPALLQTAEYRTAINEHLDLDIKSQVARMKTNVERQDMLWDQSRRYALLVHESALYTRIVSKTAHLKQLDRIERFFGLPHIKIGIIPVGAGLTVSENGSFGLYDQCCVKATITGDQITRDPEEILAYNKVFAALEKLASYEDDAQAIIKRAMRLCS